MKLYVPNPQKWVDFFDRISSGKARLNQTGGGRRSSVIPLNVSEASDDKGYPIKAVLPTEQTTAQAKSELERQDINPSDVVNMFQSSTNQRRQGIKRKRRSNKQSRKGVKRRRVSGKKSTRTAKQRRVGKKRKLTEKRILRKKERRQLSGIRKKDIFEIK